MLSDLSEIDLPSMDEVSDDFNDIIDVFDPIFSDHNIGAQEEVTYSTQNYNVSDLLSAFEAEQNDD